MKQSILLSVLLTPPVTACVIAHVRIDNCVFDGPGKEMGGTVLDNNMQVCQGGSNKFIAEKYCMKCRAGTSFCVEADGRSAAYTNGGYSATLKLIRLQKCERIVDLFIQKRIGRACLILFLHVWGITLVIVGVQGESRGVRATKS
jgi:hypothetical protein